MGTPSWSRRPTRSERGGGRRSRFRWPGVSWGRKPSDRTASPFGTSSNGWKSKLIRGLTSGGAPLHSPAHGGGSGAAIALPQSPRPVQMPDAKLIGLPADNTPTDLQTSTGHHRQFPADLLRQASHRLQVLALIGAGLWLIGPLLAHLAFYLITPANARPEQFGPTDIVAAVAFLMSLGLYLYLRAREHDPQFIINLGLGYMVASAGALALMFHLRAPMTGPMDVSPMISWIGPIILMFAALVPGSPWKLFLAGLVAASMDPLGMAISQAVGHYQYGPFRNALVMHYPSYLLLGVAVVISRVVTRLGRQVAKEREMGSYRLGELLGRGGMGEVYRATHRMLARPAAIKLIHPEMLQARDKKSADLAIARFHREAEVAASLRSPHTVELYDFGITEDQTLYFVMELLEGLDLETLVRQHGPLPAARVVRILVQTCESLEEAHQRGLVHRDIKPANIHVGRLGVQNDFVKVLDFGLVKSIPGSSGES